jgi:calcium-dependent protein kinase
LKPENFLFLTPAEDAPVKIIDFGLSRHDDADLGIMQTKVGTPYYVAPEVLRREYTNMCDIWSIGVITYILLCGYPPFYGDSDTQIFESVKVGKFDFPSPEWDEISQSAKDFVIQLLKKDPRERPSAREGMHLPWLKEQLGEQDENLTELKRTGLLALGGERNVEFTKYLAMKKLKKAALGYIASNLTQAEVGTLEDIFRTMDKNGDGFITLTDMDEALAKGNFINENIRHDLRNLRHDFAISDEDKLNWKTFLAATIDRSIALRDENLKRVFEHFKHTDTDYLTIQDLSDIFGGVSQAKEVMDLIDTNNDGKVSYEDFCQALQESFQDDSPDKIDGSYDG